MGNRRRRNRVSRRLKETRMPRGGRVTAGLPSHQRKRSAMGVWLSGRQAEQDAEATAKLCRIALPPAFLGSASFNCVIGKVRHHNGADQLSVGYIASTLQSKCTICSLDHCGGAIHAMAVEKTTAPDSQARDKQTAKVESGYSSPRAVGHQAPRSTGSQEHRNYKSYSHGHSLGAAS